MLREDLQVIANKIPNKSRVLDLGCGDGSLIYWLKKNKECACYGEIGRASCRERV